ncbi:nicotinate-nucleotide adenylyltransferase [Pasteuria penetrans]|uniref:nicotinate-nucleotide adenylyltransferase n=1 Tax=Pasteuria penetrans TaxID=86005 RepID=UPI000F98633D|nr:nicotinate-nucleotide adenylyltransferase [Pasteuria penetrans]
MRRIGLLGGTFDPIHQGHLWLAECARDALQLQEVWFIPAPKPPHKDRDSLLSAEHRVAMVRLALAHNSHFRLCTVELQRPGFSYTVDTLAQLVRVGGGEQFFLLLGADSAGTLASWYRSECIPRYAQLVILARPGVKMPEIPKHFGFVHYLTPAVGFWLSSSVLRRRLLQGCSVQYLVPDRVLSYIYERGLYGCENKGK